MEGFANQLIQGAQETAQDGPKDIAAGTSVFGDIIEKSADAKLKTGENDRANAMLPVNIEQIKANIQDRMAEIGLKKQQLEDARLTHLGAAFTSAQKLQRQYLMMDPAFQKSDRGQAMAQRVADIYSQMGIKHTADDIQSGAASDDYRAAFLSSFQDSQSADPKDNAKALETMSKAGIDPSDFPQEMVKQRAELNKVEAENVGKVAAAQAQATGKTDVAKIKGEFDLQKADIESGIKNKNEFNKRVDGLRSQYLQVEKSKQQDQITKLNDISGLANMTTKTNINNALILGGLNKYMDGRSTDPEFVRLENSQGWIAHAMQTVKQAFGYGDKGKVEFKKLTPVQESEVKRLLPVLRSDINNQVDNMLGPIYKQTKSLEREANDKGYDFTPTQIIPASIWNKAKSIQDKFSDKENEKTGLFDEKPTPIKGNPANPPTRTAAPTASKVFTTYGVTGKDQTSLVGALRRGASLQQINSKLKKPMTNGHYLLLKKLYNVQ